MRSKLLQRVNRDINESRDVVGRQQENDSSNQPTGMRPGAILSTRRLTPRAAKTFQVY
jgi:hypothetical protein